MLIKNQIGYLLVAPLAGSVGRNWCVEVAAEKNTGRSPRGERG